MAVCPTADRRQRILGRLSLIKQYQCLFLCWLPYTAGGPQLQGSAKDGGTSGAAGGGAANGRAANGAGGAAEKDRSMYAVSPLSRCTRCRCPLLATIVCTVVQPGCGRRARCLCLPAAHMNTPRTR